MSASTLPGTSAAPLVPVVAIVGVGLIGGSFAAAVRQSGLVTRIVGAGRPGGTLARARALGLIDDVVSLEQAAQTADLILIAAPVGATAQILATLKPYLRPETIVTDAGSTKADVVTAARQVLGEQVGQFIPGHPIAGAEATGPEAADAELFQGRSVVLTPLAENSSASKALLTRLWEACGARIVSMEPDTHDTVLASVSHVPHLLSSIYMWQVATAQDSDLRMALAGTGFRDFTRISAGSAEVWRDIFLSNRPAVLAELQEVKAALARAEQALVDGDSAALEDFLDRAALARRLWGSRSGLA